MKKKIIYPILLMVIFVGAAHALSPQYEPYRAAHNGTIIYEQLISPSEQYYNQQLSKMPFPRGVVGGIETGDFGDDTSDTSNLNDASDVPLGDGILPLLLLALGYLICFPGKKRK